MLMIYQLIKTLIENNKQKGISLKSIESKIDVFYACDKLTDEQYAELLELVRDTKQPEETIETDVPENTSSVSEEVDITDKEVNNSSDVEEVIEESDAAAENEENL